MLEVDCWMDMNYFAEKFRDHCCDSDKEIPDKVLDVLDKPLSSLTYTEVEIYNKHIGPHQESIRAALLAEYDLQGSPKNKWEERINPYHRTIVEEIAAQVLGMESAAALPTTVATRIPYRKPESSRKDFARKPLKARRSYKRPIIAAIILVLIGMLALAVIDATAPSRALSGIKGEIERGEYSLAIKHIDELAEKHPGKAQAEEALFLKPEAALRYAAELHERARYEEAIQYFEIAAEIQELEQEATLGCINAYVDWAKVLSEEGDYSGSYECCESALGIAPDGYDTGLIMSNRAELLFNWGTQLKEQGLYAMSAIRFEKCFAEWPAGPLAQQARVNYVEMTVSGYTNQLPNKNPTSNGEVEVRISNPTTYDARCFFSGPSSTYVDIGPSAATTLFLTPGIYSEGYLTLAGGGFDANISYELIRGYWEIIIPAPQLAATQAIDYSAVIARVDELRTTLPPELFYCFDELRYEQITDPARAQDRYGDYDPRTDTIGFTLEIPPDALDRIIFHEWGHAFSYKYLSSKEKEEYMRLRGILPGTKWDNREEYTKSVEEDFAEVFAVVFGGVEWVNHTVYGPVHNPEEIRAVMLSAAN